MKLGGLCPPRAPPLKRGGSRPPRPPSPKRGAVPTCGDAPKWGARSHLGRGGGAPVDHAAQFFTAASDDGFAAQVAQWATEGVVQRWSGDGVGVLQLGGAPPPRAGPPPSAGVLALAASGPASSTPVRRTTFTPYSSLERGADVVPRWIGSRRGGGIGGIATFMATKQLRHTKVVTDAWVSPSNGLKRNDSDGSWGVKVSGKVVGTHDCVVIAHNGKCAHRITSRTPAKVRREVKRRVYCAVHCTVCCAVL